MRFCIDHEPRVACFKPRFVTLRPFVRRSRRWNSWRGRSERTDYLCRRSALTRVKDDTPTIMRMLDDNSLTVRWYPTFRVGNLELIWRRKCARILKIYPHLPRSHRHSCAPLGLLIALLFSTVPTLPFSTTIPPSMQGSRVLTPESYVSEYSPTPTLNVSNCHGCVFRQPQRGPHCSNDLRRPRVGS
jgi:hypothetical protein